MKKISVLLGLFGILAIMTAGFAGVKSPKSPSASTRKPMTRFALEDKDKDSKISLKEFTAYNRKLKNANAVFKAKDKDNDGYLTEEEFNAK
ncbi:MAG: hypothetical protein JXN64_10285 [Spirochaetes bacterium]|nr:hypothetical protein [Spirochaetota bacterium]